MMLHFDIVHSSFSSKTIIATAATVVQDWCSVDHHCLMNCKYLMIVVERANFAESVRFGLSKKCLESETIRIAV